MNKIIFDFTSFFGPSFIFYASWSDNHIVEFEIEDKRTRDNRKSSLDEDDSDFFIRLIDEIDLFELDEEYDDDSILDGAQCELVVVKDIAMHRICWQDTCEPEILKNIYRAVNLCEPLINFEEED